MIVKNFNLNKAPNIPVFKNISEVSSEYDIVVANILLNILLDIHADLVKKIKPGGYLILSGITEDQVEFVAVSYGFVTIRGCRIQGNPQLIQVGINQLFLLSFI